MPSFWPAWRIVLSLNPVFAVNPWKTRCGFASQKIFQLISCMFFTIARSMSLWGTSDIGGGFSAKSWRSTTFDRPLHWSCKHANTDPHHSNHRSLHLQLDHAFMIIHSVHSQTPASYAASKCQWCIGVSSTVNITEPCKSMPLLSSLPKYAVGPKGKWQITMPSGSPLCSCTMTTSLCSKVTNGIVSLVQKRSAIAHVISESMGRRHLSSHVILPTALNPPHSASGLATNINQLWLETASKVIFAAVLHNISTSIHPLGTRKPRSHEFNSSM